MLAEKHGGQQEGSGGRRRAERKYGWEKAGRPGAEGGAEGPRRDPGLEAGRPGRGAQGARSGTVFKRSRLGLGSCVYEPCPPAARRGGG